MPCSLGHSPGLSKSAPDIASPQSLDHAVGHSIQSGGTGSVHTGANTIEDSDNPGSRSVTVSLTPSTPFGIPTIEHSPANRASAPGTYPSDNCSCGSLPTASLSRSLELMHHWTTVTSKTLALRSDMQHVWSITVPHIAYDYQFLMHGILAVTAMHKAYLLPGQRETYHDIAAYHQMLGIEGFRRSKSSFGDKSWKAHFCFSSLLTLVVCCQPVRVNPAFRSHSDIPDILELFVFVRGLQESLSDYQSKLTFTQLSPLVHGVWIVTQADPSYR